MQSLINILWEFCFELFCVAWLQEISASSGSGGDDNRGRKRNDWRRWRCIRIFSFIFHSLLRSCADPLILLLFFLHHHSDLISINETFVSQIRLYIHQTSFFCVFFHSIPTHTKRFEIPVEYCMKTRKFAFFFIFYFVLIQDIDWFMSLHTHEHSTVCSSIQSRSSLYFLFAFKFFFSLQFHWLYLHAYRAKTHTVAVTLILIKIAKWNKNYTNSVRKWAKKNIAYCSHSEKKLIYKYRWYDFVDGWWLVLCVLPTGIHFCTRTIIHHIR